MKKFLALALALTMALSLAACGGSSSGSNDSNAADNSTDSSNTESGTTFEKQTWRYACSATENTCWADMGRDFGQMVSDATGGAITVEVYAADQLTAGNQSEGIQAVMDGATQLSAHSNLIYSAFDQRLNVVSLPFLFDSFDDVDAKLDGDAGKAVGEVVESMGLHLLGIAENGFRHPTNSKHPIASLADMKGLKIRVAGSSVLNNAYQAWGANWANANWSEVFTALQTGTYDGQENPLPTADGASIAEVQKYVTYWTGVVDESDLCYLGDTPYGLTNLLGLRREEIDALYDGETCHCAATDDGAMEADGSILCEVAALNDIDPATPLMLYAEDYYAGCPAAAVHAFGKGQAYYLASRFNADFYNDFYAQVCEKAGLQPAWPEQLPAGVLATRRGDFVFMQNCNDHSVDIDGVELEKYSTRLVQLEPVDEDDES